MKTNFWNDAAKYGAIIGGLSALASLLTDLTGTALFNLVYFCLYIYLLYRFTKNRTRACSRMYSTYGYGSRLGFIVGMAPFIGLIQAAYGILASRLLFPEKYAQAYELTFSVLKSTGLYTSDMIDKLYGIIQSPLWLTASSIMGQLFLNLLIGLIVAATIQTASPFDGDPDKPQA